MAEGGLLSSALVPEENAEGDAEASAASSLDPAAGALAMQAARADATLAAKAAAYFVKQTHLIGLQAEHLHEQRRIVLANLKLKRLSETLRIGWQLCLGVIAFSIATYLVLMVHDAITSRTVIVEPFDAPPALQSAGRSGEVLASALLDQLTTMQAATQATAAKRDLANSWSNDIKVEVPETGISLGEIDRLLKARLGHETHIGGDLVELDGNRLALTVRGDAMRPKTFEGPSATLDQLIRTAGEYVYGETQPALYAVYLLHSGRNQEAIAFAKSACLTASPAERPYLYNAWAGATANLGFSLRDALALEQAALALKPDYWTAYANAAEDAQNLGQEETAWRLGMNMLHAAGGRPGAASELNYASLDLLTGNFLAARNAQLADATAHAGIGSVSYAANTIVAWLDIGLHDFADAALRLDTADMTDAYTIAIAHYVHGRMAAAAADTQAARREMDAWGAANADPAVSGGNNSYHCDVGQAEDGAGNYAAADIAFAAGRDFVDCRRFQADSLDHRGNWPQARKAYADAITLAPDLPFAYYSWGLALARHGDRPGALRALSKARSRAPRWADPMKAEGDILAQQGHTQAASRNYRAALRYAPAWTDLQRALR